MARLCPNCGSKVKSNKTTKDKYGAKHTFITCPNCGLKKHVYLNDDGSIGREFMRYNSKYSKEDLDYMEDCERRNKGLGTSLRQHITNCFTEKPKIKLNIKVKPQNEGTLIKLDPNTQPPSIEELEKTFSKMFY